MNSSVRSGTSTMSELDKTEGSIQTCYYRLEILEKSLKYRPMTEEEREETERGIEELRNILKKHELELKTLRKENQGSTLIAVILVITSFLLFGIYHMLTTGMAETGTGSDPVVLTF